MRKAWGCPDPNNKHLMEYPRRETMIFARVSHIDRFLVVASKPIMETESDIKETYKCSNSMAVNTPRLSFTSLEAAGLHSSPVRRHSKHGSSFPVDCSGMHWNMKDTTYGSQLSFL